MNDDFTGITSHQDTLQQEIAKIDVTDRARACNELEKKYCQFVVFNGKKKKDALRLAGSDAQDKYLSKMAYEVEQRPHVQAYMHELRNIRTAESQVELQEVVLKTRLAIEQMMAEGGKGASKTEPFLRLLAELGGFVKGGAGGGTAVQVNVPAIGSPAGSTLTEDLERFQRITGG